MRLLARAQEAGEARKDTSIDDVIRFVMGITSGPFGSQEQLSASANIAYGAAGSMAPSSRPPVSPAGFDPFGSRAR